MKKEVNVLVDIEKWAHDGRGIAHIEGKTVFVAGALPGEQVEIRILRRKKDFDEAEVSKVFLASAHRVKPYCEYFESCGGCALQHIEADEQLHMKQAQLIDLFLRIGHVRPAHIAPALRSDSFYYRHKARLSVRWVEKKNKVLIGFRERKNPRYLADIEHCVILPKAFEPIQRELPSLIEAMHLTRSIPQIEIAIGEGPFAIALIIRMMDPLNEQAEALLHQFSTRHQVRIFIQPKGPESVYLLSPKHIEPYLTYSLRTNDQRAFEYSFLPNDFTQINPQMNQKMVTQALEWLELRPNDIVLDLFCGLGNFSLPIATQAAWVYGVEGSQSMVERATLNADRHGLKTLSFSCANLELPESLIPFKGAGIHKLLLDPPRAGALTWVSEIEKINPERIVYVSCDPATLARDAGILVKEKGYQLHTAGVMDMFPGTTHVESMALFIKQK